MSKRKEKERRKEEESELVEKESRDHGITEPLELEKTSEIKSNVNVTPPWLWEGADFCL